MCVCVSNTEYPLTPSHLSTPHRCVAGYEDDNVKKPIVLLETGTGTSCDSAAVEEFKTYFPDNHVAYGYLRMVYYECSLTDSCIISYYFCRPL